jgi:hypothetical protein
MIWDETANIAAKPIASMIVSSMGCPAACSLRKEKKATAIRNAIRKLKAHSGSLIRLISFPSDVRVPTDGPTNFVILQATSVSDSWLTGIIAEVHFVAGNLTGLLTYRDLQWRDRMGTIIRDGSTMQPC